MKLQNTTDFPDDVIRKMYRTVCKEIGLPLRYVKLLIIKNRSGYGCTGNARYDGKRVIVRVCRTDWQARVTWGRFKMRRATHDRVECFLWLLTHELTHCLQGYTGEFRHRPGTSQSVESHCDATADRMLRRYRAMRESYVREWAPDPETELTPEPTAAEKREAAARKNLAAWETKLKRAKNGVKKWRAKVRYYDRRALAAKKGGSK